jgi:predicted Zn-dependent protease
MVKKTPFGNVADYSGSITRKMIILHENLEKEAVEISKTLSEVYGFQTNLIIENIDSLFKAIPEFNGFFLPQENLITFSEKFNKKAVLILTDRDLYYQKNDKDEDWVFGLWHPTNISIVSNARMKRYDSHPSQKIEVHFDLYIKRLKGLSIHEIGHGVVNPDYQKDNYKEAKWVNTRKNHKLSLGLHCTDNSCVMYETVDIKSPPKEEGCLQLGKEKKYDAGLDDVLERIYPKWFCRKCLDAILVDEKYK